MSVVKSIDWPWKRNERGEKNRMLTALSATGAPPNSSKFYLKKTFSLVFFLGNLALLLDFSLKIFFLLIVLKIPPGKPIKNFFLKYSINSIGDLSWKFSRHSSKNFFRFSCRGYSCSTVKYISFNSSIEIFKDFSQGCFINYSFINKWGYEYFTRRGIPINVAPLVNVTPDSGNWEKKNSKISLFDLSPYLPASLK